MGDPDSNSNSNADSSSDSGAPRSDPDEDLATAVRELTDTIELLRQELAESDRRSPFSPASPSGPPLRPPSPREVLAFTDEFAIPAAITALESSVRALEAFQRGLNLVRTEREARDRASAAAETTSERATDVRRTTLSQLDTVLTQLQRAASSDALPADEDARELLTEARRLRDEVDTRLREATADRESGPDDGTPDTSGDSTETGTTDVVQIDIGDGRPPRDETTDETEAANGSNVDVDAELETLKDRYSSDEEPPADDGQDARDPDTESSEPDADDNNRDDSGATADDDDETDGSDNDSSSNDTDGNGE
ncbi:hypothetical protein [Natrialba sp. PRR66]|uniref:DUF7547 family protein n=1 Tax=Natrialba sp. PRR66 TaxID=3098146 RepID=UPI002B1DF59F|nr:hypothetical protein [Natrialba sp. PRR66]